MKTAIIECEIFVEYTGTRVPINHKFLCWNDDPQAKEKIKALEKEGKHFISVEGFPSF